MKIEFQEGKYGCSFILKPETAQELAQLGRMTNNSMATKPEIHLSFSDEPYCSVWIKKVKEKVQKNFIDNKKGNQ